MDDPRAIRRQMRHPTPLHQLDQNGCPAILDQVRPVNQHHTRLPPTRRHQLLRAKPDQLSILRVNQRSRGIQCDQNIFQTGFTFPLCQGKNLYLLQIKRANFHRINSTCQTPQAQVNSSSGAFAEWWGESYPRAGAVPIRADPGNLRLKLSPQPRVKNNCSPVKILSGKN